ncbi:MAG: DUF3558 domain-containing protein [Gordonia sp. (in: high G+C Gram-positive bacteria)]|uniref:DUF3558 domain-containing protein n=1 Tax=Gordonia sp. (in: high G+C Gram-positive bacteria) TaxID=84139 RepID=UPI0039E30EAF
MWIRLLSALVVVLAAGACGADPDDGTTTRTRTPRAGTGPEFPRCGGLTADEVSAASTFPALTLFLDNTSSCEWRADAAGDGPVVSFNWYRGSPIARERGLEQLIRDNGPVDVQIAGHPGFLTRHDPLCDVGVQFGNDFIELSVYDRGRIPGRPQVSVDTLCAAAKDLAEKAITRSG